VDRSPSRKRAIGNLPLIEDLNLKGLEITDGQLAEIFRVDQGAWQQEADLTESYFGQFGEHLPAAMTRQLELLRNKLG
jgi:phosphoenolpyruvate carboxykinase (GTP)